jgi:hypothetical protein
MVQSSNISKQTLANPDLSTYDAGHYPLDPTVAAISFISRQDQQPCPFLGILFSIKFTVIDRVDINKLIYSCISYMGENLVEATELEDLDFYEK